MSATVFDIEDERAAAAASGRDDIRLVRDKWWTHSSVREDRPPGAVIASHLDSVAFLTKVDANDAVVSFVSSIFPTLPETVVRQVDMFDRKIMHSIFIRSWRAHRHVPGSSVVRHFDPWEEGGDCRVGTLLIIMPQQQSRHEGGEVTIHHRDGTVQTVDAHERFPRLVILPVGVTYEVQPLTSGKSYFLTSPLFVPGVFANMADAPTPTAEAEGSTNAQTVDELAERMEEISCKIAKMQRDLAGLERESKLARDNHTLTRTLIKIMDAAPSPPFVAIMRDFYSSSALKGDDALTFNGISSMFPQCRIRMMNVRVHLEAPAEEPRAAPVDWEWVLRHRQGWVESEHDGDDTAYILRKTKCFYGSNNRPGVVEGRVEKDGNEHEPYDNMWWTILFVHPRSEVAI